MSASATNPRLQGEGEILRTQDARDLGRIEDPTVQAVIYVPPVLPDWFSELAAEVEAGRFHVPRTILPKVSYEQIKKWLVYNFPVTGDTSNLREFVTEDILALVDRIAAISGASRFMLRTLTSIPNTECGFHVDTVPPAAVPWGLLRVYTGFGTAYVNPSNVTSMADFYRYLGRRERLGRERAQARRDEDLGRCNELDERIQQLDKRLTFLRRPDEIHVAPAGSIVQFKHLDVSLHWSSHSTSLAWIHCSPMSGGPRFLVNISPDEPVSSLSARRKYRRSDMPGSTDPNSRSNRLPLK